MTDKKSQTGDKTSKKNTDNIALYTKYRPQKFKEVLGQEHITDLLNDAIKNEKISHAYLFIGSRGTGKTSVARILAKEIGTTDNDIYEIDAASNTSVENIRDLNESVTTAPFDSNYKVYILDEVHMLSKSAFNALLKTLEEPPAHAIFVLATTEPHKIPDTVISRCETYTFKTPNREILKKMIKKTAKSEGMNLDNGATDLIAILGDGSFRDTHTILQKLLRIESVTTDSEITVVEVEKATGAPKTQLVNDVVESLVSNNPEKGLSVIREASENNMDAKVFMKLLLEKYRALLLMKVAPTQKDLYSGAVSEEDAKFLQGLLEKKGDAINSKKLLDLLEATNQSSKSYLPFLPLEIVLVG
jgi:DNA polymerase-3 subunit gamma/tau